MKWAVLAASVLLMLVVFVDVFEVMILPRRVRHGFRLARIFYRAAWVVWRKFARLFRVGTWRSAVLSVFGPLSLFALMTVWGAGLIIGFALVHWAMGTRLDMPDGSGHTLGAYLYFSGTTFFTLGYGDMVPKGAFGRTLSVAEAGIGFGFLAVVISYLPVLYQAFSHREITISLLDARAGSPPTAGELLRRLAEPHHVASAGPFLVEWEAWAAQLLESHLSFPVLRYYRSQHDNQSWVAALTIMLDTSAVLIAAVDSPDNRQARLTFAMARHAAVDLGLVAWTPPLHLEVDRLPPATFARLWESLKAAGLPMRDAASAERKLAELRALYEPLVNALALSLEFTMPAFIPDRTPVDNWQTSAWMARTPGLDGLPGAPVDDHP
jgi:hypothetical protein